MKVFLNMIKTERNIFFITGRLKGAYHIGEQLTFHLWKLTKFFQVLNALILQLQSALTMTGTEKKLVRLSNLKIKMLLTNKRKSTEMIFMNDCKKHLPFFKSPKVLIFSDSIPVTSTGKYQRNKVKDLFKEWKGMQF